MRGYPFGTKVEEKTGRIKVKSTDGKWIGLGRFEYMKTKKVDLDEFQRVFHIDGDKHNVEIKNLVPIRFNGTKYSLSHSRVLWMPKTRLND